MKVTDRDPDFWTASPDEDTSLAAFLGAAAVFAMWAIVLYLAYITLWAAS